MSAIPLERTLLISLIERRLQVELFGKDDLVAVRAASLGFSMIMADTADATRVSHDGQQSMNAYAFFEGVSRSSQARR